MLVRRWTICLTLSIYDLSQFRADRSFELFPVFTFVSALSSAASFATGALHSLVYRCQYYSAVSATLGANTTKFVTFMWFLLLTQILLLLWMQ